MLACSFVCSVRAFRHFCVAGGGRTLTRLATECRINVSAWPVHATADVCMCIRARLVVFAGMLPGIHDVCAVANKLVSPNKQGVDDEGRATRAKQSALQSSSRGQQLAQIQLRQL